MPNDQEPTGEERELLDILSKSALNDYPNPDRIGCPGESFLKQLAADRRSIPINDRRLDHVVHCSPCFGEFTAFRKSASGGVVNRRGALLAFIALAAAALLAIGLWFTGLLGGHGRPSQSTVGGKPILAEISLQDRSIIRGAPTGERKANELRVPKGQLRLTVLLPFGSETGIYQIQILRDVENPLVTAEGNAEIVDGITKLTVGLNTSSLSPGKYLLGVRRPVVEWTYDPITIR